MAILGVGLDIVDVARLRRSVDELGELFMTRVCTEAEIEYCLRGKRRVAERLGARFAAKEATAKALGTGMTREVTWHEIEVVHDPGGRPGLVLHGSTARCAEALGVRTIHLSLSHDGDVAAAVVVLEGTT